MYHSFSYTAFGNWCKKWYKTLPAHVLCDFVCVHAEFCDSAAFHSTIHKLIFFVLCENDTELSRTSANVGKTFQCTRRTCVGAHFECIETACTRIGKGARLAVLGAAAMLPWRSKKTSTLPSSSPGPRHYTHDMTKRTVDNGVEFSALKSTGSV